MNHSKAASPLRELQKLLQHTVGESTAVVLFISSAAAPASPGSAHQRQRPKVTPDVADFVRDWTSGATPLPVGPVVSTDFFSAFLTWAARFGRRVYASDLNAFVPAAIDAGSLRKRRARFRIGGSRGQAMVLCPEGAEDCGGPELGGKLAAFRRSLADWTEQAQASARAAHPRPAPSSVLPR